MSIEMISLQTEHECEALGAILAERIYEFNTKATGYIIYVKAFGTDAS